MPDLREDKSCYASSAHRETLLHLLTHPMVEEGFFLTGGTALAVFDLHHRVSMDLDLFTLQSTDLGEIDFWIKTEWGRDSVRMRRSQNFLAVSIRAVKVEFVVDVLAEPGIRRKHVFENGRSLWVDTMGNIESNKLCALASRTEPKDFVDYYYLCRDFSMEKLEDVYERGKRKEALLDDPATVAYQIEETVSLIRANPALLPRILIRFDQEDFFRFYEKVTAWIYRKGEPAR